MPSVPRMSTGAISARYRDTRVTNTPTPRPISTRADASRGHPAEAGMAVEMATPMTKGALASRSVRRGDRESAWGGGGV